MTPNNLENPKTISDLDLAIAKYDAAKGGWLHRFVRRLTRFAWKSQVRAPLSRLYERGLINSYVLHEGAAFTDAMLAARGK